MSAVIVIEIVIGIVILAAAVRFAIRDTRQRSAASPELGTEAADTGEAADTAASPAADRKAQPEQHLSEVGSAETS